MRRYRAWLALWLMTGTALAKATVILQYHHIDDHTPAATSTRVERFREHLDAIAAADFQVLSLAEVITRLEQGQPLPDRSVAITFDDAYRSIYEQAAPLLRAYGWPYTVFVNSQPVDDRYGSHMSWEQLRELTEQGATLANHSATHAHLGQRLEGESEAQWQARIHEELEVAQQRLIDETGQDHRWLAYPYGEFDQALLDQVKALGYIGFGQHSGPLGPNLNLQALPRFPLGGIYAGLQGFALKLRTLPMPLQQLEGNYDPLPYDAEPPVLTLTLERRLRLNCFNEGKPIEVSEIAPRQYRVRASEPLPLGRSRYNCTAAAGEGRFYWISHPWVRLDQQGNWPDH